MRMILPGEEPDFGPWKNQSIVSFLTVLTERVYVQGRPVMLAVDGRSGSGKTTLAARLAGAMSGAAVVHTDDAAWHHSFFNWHELLLENVLLPARAGQAVSYRPDIWDEWNRGEGAIEVPAGCKLLILEGVGAARLELMDVLDRAIWVQTDMSVARRRGLIHDGGTEAVAFWDEWMTEELPFFARQRPWERADAVVSGSPVQAYDSAAEVPVSEAVPVARNVE